MKTKEFLSLDMCADKYLTICVEIPEIEIQFTCQDEILNDLTEMLGSNLGVVEKIYGEKNVFFEPCLIYKPTSFHTAPTLGVKIGMMDKEKYEKLLQERAKRGE